MGTNSKSFLVVFLGAIALLVLGGSTLAWTAHNMGMLEVDVRPCGNGGGDRIGIRVPAVLANTALFFIPTQVFEHCDMEFERWGPLVGAACRELSQCPDFVLVEVISSDERVRVRKKGDALIVDVKDDSDRVHVSVPLGTARAFVKKLEGCRSSI